MRKTKKGLFLDQEEEEALKTVVNALRDVLYFDDAHGANTEEVNDALDLLYTPMEEPKDGKG